MRILKKLSVLLVLITGLFVFTGCGSEDEGGPNLVFEYAATKEVDKVVFKIDDFEVLFEPRQDANKVKNGDFTNVNYSSDEILKLSVEALENEEVVLSKTDIELDFTNKKNVKVYVIENSNGELDVKVENN